MKILEEKPSIQKVWTFDADATTNAQRQSIWRCGPRETISLELTIAAEHPVEQDHRVGLVQHVLSSTRTATYGMAGTGDIASLSFVLPPNCPDGEDQRTEPKFTEPPFYFKEAQATLGAPGVAATVRLTDGPTVEAARQALDPKGQARPLMLLVVDEKFLITLWDENAQFAWKQWTWGYGYTLDVETGTCRNTRMDPITERKPVSLSADGHPLSFDFVQTAQSLWVAQWVPAGWSVAEPPAPLPPPRANVLEAPLATPLAAATAFPSVRDEAPAPKARKPVVRPPPLHRGAGLGGGKGRPAPPKGS